MKFLFLSLVLSSLFGNVNAFPGGIAHWVCCAGVIGADVVITTASTGGIGAIGEIVLGTAAGVECIATGCAQFWWSGMVPMPVCTWTFLIPPPG